MRWLSSFFHWLAGTRIWHSLRVRLILLVALATLPALGFLFVTVNQQRGDALELAETEAQLLVDLIAAEQRGVIGGTQQLLTTLARLPETRTTEPAACNTLVADLQLSEGSRYAAIAVLEADGSIFCSSPTVLSAEAIAGDPAVKVALDTGTFAIGTFQPSTDGSEIPTLTFAAPIVNTTGAVVRVMYASIDLTSNSAFSISENLRPGAVIMILDSNGTLLYRQPETEDIPLGLSLAGTPVVDAVIENQPLDSVDDKDSIYAYQPIYGGAAVTSVAGEAYVMVVFPEADVVDAANDTFQANLTRLGVAVVVALIAAWIGADLFLSRDGETRKRLVSDLYLAYGSGAIGDLDNMFSPNFVDRSPAPGQRKGVEGVKQIVAAFRAAFPDGTISPNEMLADRDKVVARVTMRGTHLGEYFGNEPTGQRMTAEGLEVHRFIGGQIVESWSMYTDFVVAPQSDEETREIPQRKSLFDRLAFWRR